MIAASHSALRIWVERAKNLPLRKQRVEEFYRKARHSRKDGNPSKQTNNITGERMKISTISIVALALLIGCTDENNNSSTSPTTNHAPVIRSLTANPTTVGRQQSSQLTCVATDEDGDSLLFYWRTTSGSLSGIGAVVSWLAPNIDGEFWVSITTSDSKEVDIDSLQLTVTASNEPPARPYDPVPSDGSRNNAVPSCRVSWKCWDVDNDPITYDLYFGTNSPTIYKRDLVEKTYVLENLNSNTYYRWQVVARDNHGNTSSGPLWSFRTR